MKSVKELLRDADPLRYEPPDFEQRNFRRQAVIAAASTAHPARGRKLWPRLAVAAAVLMALAASAFGIRALSVRVGEVHAAMRFEVRLGEDQPAPGLKPTKISQSGRVVYLHDEAVVNNSDIAGAKVIPGARLSTYGVQVEFTAAGSAKMRAATKEHIGKPVAILLDGTVVTVPVVRTPIDTSAVISGNFTKAQADRIVSGIGVH